MEPYFLMVSELTKYQGVICTKNIKCKEGQSDKALPKMTAFGQTLEGGKEGSHGYLKQRSSVQTARGERMS